MANHLTALPQDQLYFIREIIEHFGWALIPFRIYDRSLTALPAVNGFDLSWSHTFYELHASPKERLAMIRAGYKPRS